MSAITKNPDFKTREVGGRKGSEKEGENRHYEPPMLKRRPVEETRKGKVSFQGTTLAAPGKLQARKRGGETKVDLTGLGNHRGRSS